MNEAHININPKLVVILTIFIILVTMITLSSIIKPAEASMIEEPELPITEPEAQEVQPVFPYEGIVNANAVRFRERPNTSSKIYEEMRRGSTVTVEGLEDGWFRVSRNGLSGYVKAEFVDALNNN